MTEVLSTALGLQGEQSDDHSLNSPVPTGEFLISPHMGRELYRIVEDHGEVTVRSAGYKQLNASDGGNILVATAFSETGHESSGEPKLFHAIIFHKEGKFLTTSISIPLETAVPLIAKTPKDRTNGNGVQKIITTPEEAEVEMTQLVKLIAIGDRKTRLNGHDLKN